MRKLLHLCASLTVLFSVHAAHASDNQSFERWHDNKFSMFIHFGLYSHLGGVWDGEPVRQGYSEQIQSFAGIFGDWYASVAQEFDPVHFDAEAVTALAKEAGVEILPVVMDGTTKIFKPKSLWFNWRNVLTVKVLPPISVEKVAATDTSVLAQEVQAVMTEALAEIRKS